MAKVRTRFAPSPTGYMHIGNLRTALYGYLLARRYDGQFILRIEDTDQERFVEDAVDVIYKTLKMTNLKHDEGPAVGGEYGPYVQSQRKEIYKEYAQKLVELGGAYYCFCSEERLESLRKEAEEKKIPFKYDGHCKSLTKEEIQKRIDNGEKYVIRQNIPQIGHTTYEDAVYGTITIENNILDENVLLKSDGLPTYNFANVIDDHLMNITHVIRGNEYISSTPKYCLLYRAYGWEEPNYIHVSQIIRPDGKKLSKRSGDASFEDFYNKGYLIDAIVNYIVLLGWSPGTTQEKFTLKELEQAFSIEGLSKSPAVFDIAKLNWLNGEYIRGMSLKEFHKMAVPYYNKVIKKQIDLYKLSELLHTRTEVLGDIPESIDFIDELPEYDVELYIHQKMKTNLDNSLESLQQSYKILSDIECWTEEEIGNKLSQLVQDMGVKNGQVLWPIRTAVSGKAFTPGGAKELAYILGKDETLNRIKIGIEKLKSV